MSDTMVAASPARRPWARFGPGWLLAGTAAVYAVLGALCWHSAAAYTPVGDSFTDGINEIGYGAAACCAGVVGFTAVFGLRRAVTREAGRWFERAGAAGAAAWLVGLLPLLTQAFVGDTGQRHHTLASWALSTWGLGGAYLLPLSLGVVAFALAPGDRPDPTVRAWLIWLPAYVFFGVALVCSAIVRWL